jgi:hypothetical protein
MSRGAALFGALGFAVCTPAFGWATSFFGHGVAGACLFIGYALVLVASTPVAARNGTRLAFLAGAALAWSVTVEFTSAPAALIVAGVGCWRLRALPSPRNSRLLAAALGGGFAGALPLAVYNLMAFGSVWHLGYSDVVGFAGMQTGLFGVSLPRGEVALALVVGAKRGILWIAPILLVAPLAWVAAFRRFGTPAALALVAVPLAYLLVNSGYAYWDGGESTGPRHLTPALPFIGFALVALWDGARGWQRRGLLALGAASFALSLVCATTMMTCPTLYGGMLVRNELTDFLLPAFLKGEVHTVLAPVGQGRLARLLALVIPVLIGLAASGVRRSLRPAVPVAGPGAIRGGGLIRP